VGVWWLWGLGGGGLRERMGCLCWRARRGEEGRGGGGVIGRGEGASGAQRARRALARPMVRLHILFHQPLRAQAVAARHSEAACLVIGAILLLDEGGRSRASGVSSAERRAGLCARR
jgi:hypothetical protein